MISRNSRLITRTLAWCNRMRLEQGQPPLSELPKGFPRSMCMCPVAIALTLTGEYSKGKSDRAANVMDNEDGGTADVSFYTDYTLECQVTAPQYVNTFIRRFDEGKIPHLEAFRGAAMSKCVVCNLEEGFCEFCPDEPVHATNVVSINHNADPGDENDYLEKKRVYDTLPSVEQLRQDAVDRIDYWSDPPEEQFIGSLYVSNPREPYVSARSYVATYKLGSTYKTDTVMGYDSFAASAALFQVETPGEGWVLVGLRELV